MTARRSQAGFTLIELMATIVCVSIVAAIAIPKVSGYVLQARLEAAKPYLMQIAARQRMYKVENGVYCCSTAGSGTNENLLAAGLGVTLSDIGEFCFVFVCQSTTLCQTTSGPSFITATSGTTPDFEVWAILQSSGATASGPGGTACTPATGKAASTGWVAAAGSNSAGRAGEVVVVRYPPPLNGAGSTGLYAPHTGQTFTWTDGISTTDARFP